MNNRGPRKLPREPHFDTELVQECAVDSKLLEQFDKYRSRLFQTHQIFQKLRQIMAIVSRVRITRASSHSIRKTLGCTDQLIISVNDGKSSPMHFLLITSWIKRAGLRQKTTRTLLHRILKVRNQRKILRKIGKISQRS